MYIIKNALRCIGRARGRNILIGIIALVIAISACIGLSIRQASESAKECIYYIFCLNNSVDVDVVDSKVISAFDGFGMHLLSDHLPVIAQVRYK